MTPNQLGRLVNLTSTDAGALLAGIGVSRNMRGGTLQLTGRFDDALYPAPLLGSLSITDFRLIQAPFLARLLKAATLGGLDDLLQGQGLSFSRLESGFVFHSGIVRIETLRAAGGSLGLTASGSLNLQTDWLDIAGNLVPVLGVNQFLDGTIGRIPVLGDMLTGTQGGGMFAASFTAKGPVSEADMSVNPLSVLTPGILRELFFEGASAP